MATSIQALNGMITTLADSIKIKYLRFNSLGEKGQGLMNEQRNETEKLLDGEIFSEKKLIACSENYKKVSKGRRPIVKS